VDPILAIPGVQPVIEAQHNGGHCPVVAVSPIIGGQAVKGPAAKMYAELGIQPSALSVARHYGALLTGFVMDTLDQEQADPVARLKVPPLVTGTVMKTAGDRRRLAEEVLAFGASLLR
jgi:LPPG:FO 2-phospho-L-lactate transferase